MDVVTKCRHGGGKVLAATDLGELIGLYQAQTLVTVPQERTRFVSIQGNQLRFIRCNDWHIGRIENQDRPTMIFVNQLERSGFVYVKVV